MGVHVARHVYIHWKDVLEIRLVDITPPPRAVLQYITSNRELIDGAKVQFCMGNVLDQNNIHQAFVKVDVVFRCAGLVETGSILNRRRMKQVNVDGMHNVLEVSCKCGVH